MKTQEMIEAFKTWDGAAFLKSHMLWLKGSYQSAQLSKDVSVPKLERKKVEKQKPFINYEKRAYKAERAAVGHRKAKWYS